MRGVLKGLNWKSQEFLLCLGNQQLKLRRWRNSKSLLNWILLQPRLIPSDRALIICRRRSLDWRESLICCFRLLLIKGWKLIRNYVAFVEKLLRCVNQPRFCLPKYWRGQHHLRCFGMFCCFLVNLSWLVNILLYIITYLFEICRLNVC